LPGKRRIPRQPDRIVKFDQYACPGVAFYWRAELTADAIPVVYTYLLDPAGRRYREADVFTGLVKPGVLFPLEIDLTTLR
jgi:hypothetical protein